LACRRPSGRGLLPRLNERQFRAEAERLTRATRLVAACVTTAHITSLRDPGSFVIAARLGRGEPARLRGSANLGLRVDELWQRTNDERWDLRYRYSILRSDTQHEILSFHRHGSNRPHLHLGAGAGELFEPLYKAHVPTGPVALTEVVLMLVRDFGVEPLRADWETVLEAERRD